MKKRKTIPLILGITFFSMAALADGPTGPCAPIAAACTAAGFQKLTRPTGGSGREAFQEFRRQRKTLIEQGKDFRFNCMKPLLHGEPVNGVTADPSWDLAACKAQIKARREARHEKWKAEHEQNGQN